MRRRAFVALGANLGDRARTLDAALGAIGEVVAVSHLYETEPVGGPGAQPRYLNAVCELDTDRSPFCLLDDLLALELRHGRERSVPNAPRTLDLDVVWMDGVIVSSPPRLVLPHPRAFERAFVLWPLADLDAALARSLAGGSLAGLERPPIVAHAAGCAWTR